MMESASQNQIRASLPYLERSPLYEIEKPYSSNFDVSGFPGARATNHKIQRYNHIVHDIRHQDQRFTLASNGFEHIKAETGINATNCDNADFLSAKCKSDIGVILRQNFPYYSKILYLDHQVRKRSALFPSKPGQLVKYLQPAAMPHIDFTSRGAFIRMSHFFSKDMYEEKSFDLIK
jgi:hypothetical protein